MGRRPTIDRDRVLDLAEAILLRSGTGALTIDALAKAAGVSKGGIQSRFGSKSELISALMTRCIEEYEAEAAALSSVHPTPLEAVRGHLIITQRIEGRSPARAAGLVAALIEDREHLAAASQWYQARFAELDTGTDEGRRARLALYAVEGAFILRSFGFIRQDEGDWHATMGDITALLDGIL